jgi:hypothetical protein
MNSQKSKTFRNRLVVSGVLLVGAFFFALPIYIAQKQKQIGPIIDSQKPLNPQQIMRGPFSNAGSKDIGPDPDYQKRKRYQKHDPYLQAQ